MVADLPHSIRVRGQPASFDDVCRIIVIVMIIIIIIIIINNNNNNSNNDDDGDDDDKKKVIQWILSIPEILGEKVSGILISVFKTHTILIFEIAVMIIGGHIFQGCPYRKVPL